MIFRLRLGLLFVSVSFLINCAAIKPTLPVITLNSQEKIDNPAILSPGDYVEISEIDSEKYDIRAPNGTSLYQEYKILLKPGQHIIKANGAGVDKKKLIFNAEPGGFYMVRAVKVGTTSSYSYGTVNQGSFISSGWHKYERGIYELSIEDLTGMSNPDLLAKKRRILFARVWFGSIFSICTTLIILVAVADNSK